VDNKPTGFSSEARKYIGQYYDEGTGLNYLNARYYEGSRGQFLSQDPVFWEIGQTQDGIKVLSNPQLQNSYSYAGGNPITNKDPDGRILDTIADVGFIAYDLYQVGNAYYNGGDVREQLGYLGLDVAGAATPFATGFGAAARVANVANKVGEVNKASNAVQTAIEAGRAEQARLGFPSVKTGSAGGETTGKRFSDSVINQTRQDSKGVCVFCGSQTTQSKGPLKYNNDHSIPRSQGGNATPANSQSTCQTCNLQKGSMNSSQFIQKVKSILKL
jgi:RHS repeat-associated protein